MRLHPGWCRSSPNDHLALPGRCRRIDVTDRLRHRSPLRSRGAGLDDILPGFSKDRPSIVQRPGVHSGSAVSGAPSGRGPPALVHVPPSWFRTTSTVSSSRTPPGCCTGLPILGFAAFLASAPEWGARLVTAAARSFPAASSRRLRPCEALLPECSRSDLTAEGVAPADVHGRSCLLALRPPAFPPTAWTSRPSSAPGAVHRDAVARATMPLLPWARPD